MGNRFYMYNYCWENFIHHELNYTNGHYEEIGEPKNLLHHKAFPYAFFCMAFVLALPTVFWTLTESDRVKRQATYIMNGVEEGLTMTISVMSDMVKDKSEYNKSDANVGTRMRKIIREKYKEEIDLKFKAFEAFLAKKAASNRLARGFIMRRIITFFLLIGVGVFMFKVYFLDEQDFFNCKLNWKAKNQAGGYGPVSKPSGTDYVRCSIGDVSTRRLLIVIYLAIVILCGLAIIILTIKDSIEAQKAFSLLEMIPMISEDNLKEKLKSGNNGSMPALFSWFGLKDVHILLFLAKENFSEHKLFQTCNQARCMAKSVKVDYEAVLESLVSWGLEDDSDTAAEAIVGNAFKAQQ